MKRINDPVKGAPQLEEDLNDPHILSDKMAQVKITYEDESKQDSSLPQPETVTAVDYLKQIYSGQRTAHFQADYDNLQKLIKKREVLDSKGLYSFSIILFISQAPICRFSYFKESSA